MCKKYTNQMFDGCLKSGFEGQVSFGQDSQMLCD